MFLAFFVLNIITQGVERIERMGEFGEKIEKIDKVFKKSNTQSNMNINMANNNSTSTIS